MAITEKGTSKKIQNSCAEIVMPKSEVLDTEEIKAELESLLQTGSLKEILEKSSSNLCPNQDSGQTLDENFTKSSFRVLNETSDTIDSENNLPILLMAKPPKKQNVSANI